MSQSAPFICNATPIAYLPFYSFDNSLTRTHEKLPAEDSGHFRIVRCIIAAIEQPEMLTNDDEERRCSETENFSVDVYPNYAPAVTAIKSGHLR